MHPSSFNNMKLAISKIPLRSNIDVVDIGGRSLDSNHNRSYQSLLRNTYKNYYIVDIVDGIGVTHVMKDQYTLPFEDNSVDLVLSGQVLEHVNNFFKFIDDCKRILKPNHYMIHIAPSEKGSWHDNPDNWRFGRDSMKTICNECGLELVSNWIDVSAPDQRSRKWADNVMIARKK